MKKISLLILFTIFLLISVSSVSAVAWLDMSFSDNSYHKDLQYNQQANLKFSVFGIYYPVVYNSNVHQYGNNNVYYQITEASGITYTGIGNQAFSLDTSIFEPGLYEIKMFGYDLDLQVVNNPVPLTFSIPSLPYITLNPQNPTTYVNEQIQFTASGGSSGNYIWSITSGNQHCSIDNNGLLTANSIGICTVKAKDTGSPAFATTNVNIVQIPSYNIVPQNYNLGNGQSAQFTVQGGSGSDSWSVTSGPCTINQQGLVTLNGNSNCVIRADDNNSPAFDIATVTYVPAASITVIPPFVTLYPSETQQFTASGGTSYTWSITSGNQHCSINQNGLLTANSIGTCTVRADDTATSGFGTATVNIINLPQITLSPQNPTTYVNEQIQFTATGGTSYTWSITSGNQHCSINQNGLLTALSFGICNVRVTDISSAFATTNVNVLSIPNYNIVPDNIDLYQGQSGEFTIIGGSNDDTWSVLSGPCTITQTGLVTLVGLNNCIIRADDNNSPAFDTATVTYLGLPNYNIVPDNIDLYQGQSGQFIIQGGNNDDTWSVLSGPCTITQTGLVTLNGNSNCVIRADDNVSPAFDTATVTYVSAPRIIVTPSPVDMYVGSNQEFTATGGSGLYDWEIIAGSESCQINQNLQSDSVNNLFNILLNLFRNRDISIIGTSSIVVNAISEGPCVLQASDVSSPGVGYAYITVISVPEIVVVPNYSEIEIDDVQVLTATGGTSDKYKWSIIQTGNICSFVNNPPVIGIDPGVNPKQDIETKNSRGIIPEPPVIMPTSSSVSVKGLSSGTCIVRATDLNLPLYGEGTIVVLDEIIPPNYTIIPDNINLDVNEQGQFTVVGGSNDDTWSVLSGPCTITQTGLVTLNGNSNCVIRADDNNSNLFDTATVTYVPISINYTIIPDNINLDVNEQDQFTVVGGSNDDTWSVLSGPCTIDQTGLVTLNGNSNCVIRADDNNSNLFDTATVTYVPISINYTIIPDNINLDVTEQGQFTVVGGSNDDTWSVLSGPCTITQTGLVTLNGNSNCVIRADDNNSNLFDTATVTYVSTTINYTIIPDNINLDVNEQGQFTIVGGSNDDYWSVLSGPCTITQTGLVTLNGNSNCVIRADDNNSNLFDTATVTYVPISINYTIIPDNINLDVTEQGQFTVVGGSGNDYWSVLSGPCTITQTGLVTLNGNSNCVIRADDNNSNLFDTATVTYVPISINYTIIPDNINLDVTEQGQFTVVGGSNDDYWSVLSGPCTIDQTGLVTLNGNSNCVIRADDNNSNLFDTATVTYVPTTINYTIIPDNINLDVNEQGQFTIVGGSNDDTWSVLSGPCTIDQTGLVTLNGNSNCVIRADDNNSNLFDTATVTYVPTTINNLVIIPNVTYNYPNEIQIFTAQNGISGIYFWETYGNCEVFAAINDQVNIRALNPGICLITVTDSGQTATATMNILDPVEISIDPSLVYLDINETQQFTASGGCAYTWDVVGSCSVDQNGFLTALGYGTCWLTVFDKCSPGFATATIHIIDSSINPVTAKIHADPYSGVSPLYVRFDGEGTGIGELTYDWYFGSLFSEKSGITVYNTYVIPARYEVRLTVTDSTGRSATDIAYIDVLTNGQVSDRSRGRITIKTLEVLEENSIYPGSQAKFLTSIENNGQELRQFGITVVVPELGIWRPIVKWNLKGIATRIIPLEIPLGTEPGVYTARVTYGNGEYRRTVHRDFIVK
jgi:adenosine/AMP kinase